MNKDNILKIATYNILFSINAQDIITNILTMANKGVMVFCLQEVINTKDKKFIIEEILNNLGKNWKARYHLGNEGSLLDFGTCILWNNQFLKLEKIEKIQLPKINHLAIHEFLFDKLAGHKGIPVQRRVISGLFMYQNNHIAITNVHLDNVGGKRNRLKQLEYLLKILYKNNEVTHQIICGDFNSFDLLKTGVEKQELQRALGKDFKDASKNVSWTADIYNMDLPQKTSLLIPFIKITHLHIKRKLDYIWVKNLQVQDCNIIQLRGSDHHPMIATLKVI